MKLVSNRYIDRPYYTNNYTTFYWTRDIFGKVVLIYFASVICPKN